MLIAAEFVYLVGLYYAQYKEGKANDFNHIQFTNIIEALEIWRQTVHEKKLNSVADIVALPSFSKVNKLVSETVFIPSVQTNVSEDQKKNIKTSWRQLNAVFKTTQFNLITKISVANTILKIMLWESFPDNRNLLPVDFEPTLKHLPNYDAVMAVLNTQSESSTQSTKRKAEQPHGLSKIVSPKHKKQKKSLANSEQPDTKMSSVPLSSSSSSLSSSSSSSSASLSPSSSPLSFSSSLSSSPLSSLSSLSSQSSSAVSVPTPTISSSSVPSVPLVSSISSSNSQSLPDRESENESDGESSSEESSEESESEEQESEQQSEPDLSSEEDSKENTTSLKLHKLVFDSEVQNMPNPFKTGLNPTPNFGQVRNATFLTFEPRASTNRIDYLRIRFHGRSDEALFYDGETQVQFIPSETKQQTEFLSNFLNRLEYVARVWMAQHVKQCVDEKLGSFLMIGDTQITSEGKKEPMFWLLYAVRVPFEKSDLVLFQQLDQDKIQTLSAKMIQAFDLKDISAKLIFFAVQDCPNVVSSSVVGSLSMFFLLHLGNSITPQRLSTVIDEMNTKLVTFKFQN